MWTEDNLRRAVKQVIVEKMSKKQAALLNNIRRPTLIRHIKKANLGLGVKKQPGRPTVLSEEQEMELVVLIQDMESRLYGLTITDVRRIVYLFCEKNAIPNTFNQQDGMAGRNWIKLFLGRHSDLSVRKPEAVSIQRAIGFNRAKVDIFFDLLEKTCYDASGMQIIPYENIFNVDESGFTCVQKPQKIVATKGKKNVGTLTSAEKGKTITVVCCMSAAGTFVPPMFIFPRMRMKESLMDHSPPGSVGTCTKTGWINEAAFDFWLDHFLRSVRPQNMPQPVLLVMDGHSSHTRNLNVLLKARDNNVILLCLPSHCTHRLQPLDVSFFKGLNSRYDEALRKWLRDHPGRKVNEEQVAELFSVAYGTTATVETAVNGFRKTGIAPFNRDIFSDADFRGAEMTDHPLLSEVLNPSIDSRVTDGQLAASSVLQATAETRCPDSSAIADNANVPDLVPSLPVADNTDDLSTASVSPQPTAGAASLDSTATVADCSSVQASGAEIIYNQNQSTDGSQPFLVIFFMSVLLSIADLLILCLIKQVI